MKVIKLLFVTDLHLQPCILYTRGVMDESGEQFVAYCLPTEETLQKRRRDAAEGVPYMDEDTYEYKMAREYNWNVKSKASKGYEENYFLVSVPI